MIVICIVGINNTDLQKSSETTNTQNAEEKKSLWGERTASKKNRYTSALMSKSQKNSEDLEERPTFKNRTVFKFSVLYSEPGLTKTLGGCHQ